jgi:hypothetical protein
MHQRRERIQVLKEQVKASRNQVLKVIRDEGQRSRQVLPPLQRRQSVTRNAIIQNRRRGDRRRREPKIDIQGPRRVPLRRGGACWCGGIGAGKCC